MEETGSKGGSSVSCSSKYVISSIVKNPVIYIDPDPFYEISVVSYLNTIIEGPDFTYNFILFKFIQWPKGYRK